MDEYFVLQDKPIAFAVNGQTVIVDSEKLAKALLCLSEGWREIILMRYYLQLRDRQIAALLGKMCIRDRAIATGYCCSRHPGSVDTQSI